MSEGPIVCDASPPIGLAQIGRLNLLRQLYAPVLAPPAVVAEIVSVAARPTWLLDRPPPQPIDARILAASLGPGESEAIAVALVAGTGLVLLDDLQARKLAARLGIPVIGTIGVLLAAKRRGFLAMVRPEIETLQRERFHLSPDLVAEALADVGEGG